MPEKFDLEKGRVARNRREVENSRENAKKLREELSQMRKIDFDKMRCLPGDRTENTPPLRIHARQSMRFDKELSTHTYSVEPNGKYWFGDVKATLAVITHARMIIASRKPLEHPIDDDGKSPFLIT